MKFKKLAVLVLVTVATAISTVSFGQVSSAKTVTKTTHSSTPLYAKKSTKAVSYQHLAPASAINKKDATLPKAPPSKGGKKGRGSAYALHIDNHTPYYANIYVGDEFAGTVPPYGDIFPVISAGSTTIRAIANFDDGSTFDWGPFAATSYGSTLTISLYK